MRRWVYGVSLTAAVTLGACDREAPPQAEKKAADAAADKADPSPPSEHSDPPEAGPKDGHDPADAGPPGVRDDGEIVSAVSWFGGTLDEALAEAKAHDKQVFIDIGAYWCPPCHRLDEEVFVKPEVGEALGKAYVAVHIDAEKGEGPEIVERYQVQAYPTMLVLEPSGIEKGRIVDFLEPDKLMAALARISAGDNVLAELIEEVEHNPDDLEKRYTLAHAYLLAADLKSADPQLDMVLLGDPKDELGLASKALYDRALFGTYKLEDKPEQAIEQLRALQSKYPDSKAAVRAYRMIGRLYCKLGREDDAVASLEAMIATNPDRSGLAAGYGWFAFRQGCGTAPALVAVQKRIVVEPDDADLRYVESELLIRQERLPEALAAMQKASEIEPKSAFYRRQVRRVQGLVEAAG